ncbi:MAG: N-glycosylase/DNA lyase [Nitrososphaerota archaeon]
MSLAVNLDLLIEEIRNLMNSDVKKTIEEKVKSFKELGRKNIEEIFKELCFCIIAAGYDAERSVRIQKEIGDGFLYLFEEALAEKLRNLGHRYPELKARYIVKAREKINELKNVLEKFEDSRQIREWLMENIEGVGYKVASHFLRNIGRMDLAIIDIHILNILRRHGVIKHFKTLTKKRYIEIEKILEKISEKLKLDLGELDLYLWYMETGKIVK